jgi:hypothetical protein
MERYKEIRTQLAANQYTIVRNIWLTIVLTITMGNTVIVYKTIEIMLSHLVFQLRIAAIENISKK